MPPETDGEGLSSDKKEPDGGLSSDKKEPDGSGSDDAPPNHRPLQNPILRSLDEEARKLYSISQRSRALQWRKQEEDETASGIAVDGQELGDEAYVEDGGLPNEFEEICRSFEGPMSLSGILARHLSNPWADPVHGSFSVRELSYLDAQGFSASDIEIWAEVVRDGDPHFAAKAPFSSCADVPLFLLVLLLRRRTQYLNQASLGALMHHCARRLKKEEINWAQLKTLSHRLLQHARKSWPEAMPWIAQLFTLETRRIIDQTLKGSRNPDIARFCNTMLVQISIPASIAPFVSAVHQQKAQFDILRFMVSQDPPIIMARRGYQAMIKTQLARQKTDQEREWAQLKGTTWPPWIHERTAMDEGKDYHFGASRATRILHRMFEAGYGMGRWEDVAQMYAGWDTDQSPTIQTRTLGPWVFRKQRWLLDQQLWAARVATTRTRREAWACFLTCEASAPGKTSDLVYCAMLEKLAADEIHEKRAGNDSDEAPRLAAGVLTPGDVKEVWPEPKSSLDLIHIAEPVPTWNALYQRMKDKKVKIRVERTLCSLLKTAPSWGLVVDILDYGRYHSLLDGNVVYDYAKPTGSPDFLRKSEEKPSDRVVAAFISALCSHGSLSDIALASGTASYVPATQADHKRHLRKSPSYLLDYAHNILFTIQPAHPPLWTAYLQSLARAWDTRVQAAADPSGAYKPDQRYLTALYAKFTAVLDKMQHLGLNLDEAQLLIVCRVLQGATTAALRHRMSNASVYKLTDGPRRIRLWFHALTSAHIAPNTLASQPPHYDLAITAPALLNPLHAHIPSPALLHAYVRTLGLFRDYEGLYSFVTWAVTHHAEVSARAQASHNGPILLRRTLVALAIALTGDLGRWRWTYRRPAPEELVALVRTEIEKVEAWGGWPGEEERGRYWRGLL